MCKCIILLLHKYSRTCSHHINLKIHFYPKNELITAFLHCVLSLISSNSISGEFGTSQAELEAREDSLADDSIDVEGFARSRLVVGSVDSDSGGLMRQESQGSLCGRSVDLDVPSSISEDVFDGSTESHRSSALERGCDQGSECSEAPRRSSLSHIIRPENCDQKASMSRGNSEVDTPDSIVVLTSDGSSPEGDSSRLSTGSTDRSKLTVSLHPEKITSPISSPESIEVLGSSSLVTSPSSIEVSTPSVFIFFFFLVYYLLLSS